MKIGQTMHCHLDIVSAVAHFDPEQWLRVCRDPDTKLWLTPAEVKARFETQIAEGVKVIPLCNESECPHFDYAGNGCPGHSSEDAVQDMAFEAQVGTSNGHVLATLSLTVARNLDRITVPLDEEEVVREIWSLRQQAKSSDDILRQWQRIEQLASRLVSPTSADAGDCQGYSSSNYEAPDTPAIGIEPEWMWRQNRSRTLFEALDRCVKGGEPNESCVAWLNEALEHTRWLIEWRKELQAR